MLITPEVSGPLTVSLGPGQPKGRLGRGGGELYPCHAVEHSVGLDDLEALDHLYRCGIGAVQVRYRCGTGAVPRCGIGAVQVRYLGAV